MPQYIMLTEVIKALMILRHVLSPTSANSTMLANLLYIKPYSFQVKLEGSILCVRPSHQSPRVPSTHLVSERT